MMKRRVEKALVVGIICIVLAGCVNSSNVASNAQSFAQSNSSTPSSTSSESKMAINSWGPERATFTMGRSAEYPIFNSITDNPSIGDERNFVRIGEITKEITDLKDSVEVDAGKRYLVYIYYHNNASATFNDKAHGNAGIATGVRLSVSIPHKVSNNESVYVKATISSDNSEPKSVWDSALITTSHGEISLSYVEGSAKIYNDHKTNGSVLSSAIFSQDGVFLGTDELDGIIPGCEEYHGIVSFVLEAK